MEYEYSEAKPPSEHHRTRTQTVCRACGVRIGDDGRRFTWRIREEADVFEYHYCSEKCLPETAPETPSTADETRPQS